MHIVAKKTISAASNGLVLGFRMFMERSFPSFDPLQSDSWAASSTGAAKVSNQMAIKVEPSSS
jgi:hypothetical protein